MDKISIVDPKLMGRGKRMRARDLNAKRVRGADGSFETIYAIDTADPDFQKQFQTVFQLNVARARRGRPRRRPAVAAE